MMMMVSIFLVIIFTMMGISKTVLDRPDLIGHVFSGVISTHCMQGCNLAIVFSLGFMFESEFYENSFKSTSRYILMYCNESAQKFF